MDKKRLLELAGIAEQQDTEQQQTVSDLYVKILQDLDDLPRNEIKEFLQQIAGEFGIDLNESAQLNEGSANRSGAWKTAIHNGVIKAALLGLSQGGRHSIDKPLRLKLNAIVRQIQKDLDDVV